MVLFCVLEEEKCLYLYTILVFGGFVVLVLEG